MTCSIKRSHKYEYRDKTEFLTVKTSKATGENYYFFKYILFFIDHYSIFF